jgi:3D (Asp-Asp-Asp) domain-containing protein
MKTLSLVFARVYAHITPAMNLVAVVSILFASLAPAQPAMAQLLWFRPETAVVSPTTNRLFPTSTDRVARRTMKITVTAYNSLPEQTDSTPFETADGTHVRDGIVAANFLPLGTRVKFPDLYGNKEFVVKDRMNARYRERVDIWMEEKHEALLLGKRYTTIEIF